MIKTPLVVAISIAVGSIATSAGAQQPEPFKASQTKTVTATIEAVDRSDRDITLVDSSGSRVVVAATDEVRTFDQLKPGDRVVVTYHEGIIAEAKPSGQGAQSETRSAGRASGAMPSKTVGKQVTTTVEIESIDRARNLVTFKNPDGTSRTLGVANLDAKEFVSKLNPGDEVQLTYSEAAAVSIKPATGAESTD